MKRIGVPEMKGINYLNNKTHRPLISSVNNALAFRGDFGTPCGSFNLGGRMNTKEHMIFTGIMAILMSTLVILLLCSLVKAEEIDMDKIKMIESSGNPKAHNTKDDSRGLYQITPILLKEWNIFFPSEQYTSTDLWSEAVNLRIAEWYMNKRIPQMLKYYKIEDTVRNRIIAYNAGISYLVNKKPIPSITEAYLRKYGVK